MAAHTLFSDSQSQLVARILNNSLKPKVLHAHSLLSMAQQVQCLSGTGCELDNLMFVDGDSVLTGGSVMPVSSSLRPAMAQTDGTELCTSSVSTSTPDVTDPDSSTPPAGDQHNHIHGLLRRLPTDVLDEHGRAEAFIRSHVKVRQWLHQHHPHRIDTGDHSLHFKQLQHHPTAQLPQASCSAELMRWTLALSEYSITFKYKEGKSNTAEDCLSRIGPHPMPLMEQSSWQCLSSMISCFH